MDKKQRNNMLKLKSAAWGFGFVFFIFWLQKRTFERGDELAITFMLGLAITVLIFIFNKLTEDM